MGDRRWRRSLMIGAWTRKILWSGAAMRTTIMMMPGRGTQRGYRTARIDKEVRMEGTPIELALYGHHRSERRQRTIVTARPGIDQRPTGAVVDDEAASEAFGHPPLHGDDALRSGKVADSDRMKRRHRNRRVSMMPGHGTGDAADREQAEARQTDLQAGRIEQ